MIRLSASPPCLRLSASMQRRVWDGRAEKFPHALGFSTDEARGSVRRPLPAVT